MSKEIVDALFEQGLMGIEVPSEFGGVELGFTAACLAIEEAFKRYGSKELQERYLPRLAADTVGSFCLSEPNSGSDAFALKTKAVQDGSDWVLDGGKSWISNSLEAGIFVVFANADPSKGHRGITAFVVDLDNKGLQIGKKEDKLGIRASSTCELVFEGCRVPKEAVLGEVGQGYKIAIELLNEGRIGIGAQIVGLAQGAFDYAMRYMQFGQSIADFQGMQFQYARARMEIEAARLLVFNAARLKESGRPFMVEAAMAKLKASEVAQDVSSQCIDWLGGVGFTREFLAEKYYRDAKIGTIYEGTSNIQLQTIGRSCALGALGRLRRQCEEEPELWSTLEAPVDRALELVDSGSSTACDLLEALTSVGLACVQVAEEGLTAAKAEALGAALEAAAQVFAAEEDEASAEDRTLDRLKFKHRHATARFLEPLGGALDGLVLDISETLSRAEERSRGTRGGPEFRSGGLKMLFMGFGGLLGGWAASWDGFGRQESLDGDPEAGRLYRALTAVCMWLLALAVRGMGHSHFSATALWDFASEEK
eukprot:g24755.t1